MNLTSKRILITRPRALAQELATALISEGAQPIFFPVIQILPPRDFSELDHALQTLHRYHLIIFTSIHAVDAFFKRRTFHDIKIPVHVQIAAIGSKTTKHLIQHNVLPNYVPKEYVAEAILSGLEQDISGQRILLPQSDIASKSLADGIRSAGGIADEVVVYRNVKNQPTDSEISALRGGVDIITFTSPSTVRNFIGIVQSEGLDPFNLPGAPLFACIGPVTKKAAEEAGLVNLIEANEHTSEGLMEALGNLVRS